MGCGCGCAGLSVACLPSRSSSSSLATLPRRRRRRQIGDAFSDLAAQSTQFQGAWNTIASQLQQENAGPLDVAAAKNDLASSFYQLTSSANGFGLTSDDALKAAQDYTIAGRTVLGAVDHVQGLIAAAQGDDPTQAFEMFTGTLIGAAVATGVVTAGIGAVITIGVGAALSLMKSAGLFGSPPKGKEICPGFFVDPPPTLQVGCVGSNAGAIQSGSPLWRHYPSRKGGNANDGDWFSASFTSWAGSPGGTRFDWAGPFGYRLIDYAFPDAHYLACQSVPSPLSQFDAAFRAAWTSNAEYALNGLRPQENWQVLKHLAGIWNRAHAPTSFYDLTYTPRPYLETPSLAVIAQGPTCPDGLPPFVATLVQDVLANVSRLDASILSPSQTAIRLNMGALHVPPKRVITLRLPPHAFAPSSGSAPVRAATPWSAHPSPATRGTTAAIVAGLAAVGAGAFYVWRQKKRRRPIVPPRIKRALPRALARRL